MMFSFCIFLCMFSRSSRHVSLTAHRSDLCYVVRAVAVNHKAGQIKDRNGCGKGVNSNCHTFIMSPSCPASKPFQGTSVPAIKALALLARCRDSPRRQPLPGLSNVASAAGLHGRQASSGPLPKRPASSSLCFTGWDVFTASPSFGHHKTRASLLVSTG